MNNKDLTHYGIKGQKWGVRRKRDSRTGRVKDSADSRTAKKLLKKKLSEMSNEELSKLNKRLQLERSYRDLTKQEKSKGRAAVEEVLTNVGKKVAKQYLTQATTSAMDAMIENRKKKP